MRDEHRSGCPINLSLEVFGDKWSLLILRDMMFGGRRHYRNLLLGSQEGISSNILADRLKSLMALGMLTRADDPSHKQKGIYSLTEMAIGLVPIMAHLGIWGSKWLPVSEELSIRATLLDDGGPAMWEQFMSELRAEHVGEPLPHGQLPSVRANLQAGYQAVMVRKAQQGRVRQ